MNSVRTWKNSFIAFFAALLSVFTRRKKSSNDDLRNIDFKTSTQSLGVRFTDRVRDVFRFRWIRRN
ncbi:MAG: hypothetical protein WC374_00860 [Phycisphaerae bacterium]|jgi:hypothetical protein